MSENYPSSFLSVDDLLHRLSVSNPTQGQLNDIQIVINSVMSYMQKYTGRKLIYTENIVEEYEPSYSEKLFLKNYPNIEITSIYDNNDNEITDYEIRADRYIYYDGIWSERYYIITYNAGYTESDNEYSQLKSIQLELVMSIWKRGGAEHLTIDQYGVANFDPALLQTDYSRFREMLDYYRNIQWL